MSRKFRVIVACGAGIATSTIVTDRVERLLKENNMDAEVRQVKIAEAKQLEDSSDLIVSTTILPTTYSIPAIVATSYISGINEEATDTKILNALKEIESS